MDTYVKRLEDLQAIADSFAGVEKSFAVQAGREIRILVDPRRSTTSPRRASRATSCARSRNADLPGQIKVTVIRETRAMEYAK